MNLLGGFGTGDLGDLDGDLFTENIPARFARLNRFVRLKVLPIFANIEI